MNNPYEFHKRHGILVTNIAAIYNVIMFKFWKINGIIHMKSSTKVLKHTLINYDHAICA